MHVIVLAVGLGSVIAGVALTVLNLPVDMARLADTLLIVGMVAIVGGAILTGLASANRQLRRIAQLLDSEASPRAAGTVGLVAAPLSETPPKPEPAPQAAPVASVEPGVLESRVAAERTFDPGPRSEFPAHPVVLDPPVADAPVSSPPPAPRARVSFFDAMWSRGASDPHEDRRTHDNQAAAGTPAPNAAADEPRPDAGASVTATAPQDGEAVRVFKSGVIDGMAYTLYTDGSIEAELPQGTVRFASVDELRIYLDG